MKRIITLFVMAFILFIPHSVEAHASLIDANPIQYETVDKAPTEVHLTFNERLQDQLYYIKVYDSKGKLVSKTNTKLSSDHTELSVGLLPLKKGNYTVSYHIISADGHIIDYSYLFTYGHNDDSTAPQIPSNYSSSGHAHIGYQFLFYAAYYILFLAFAGWILIGILRPSTIVRQKAEYYKALRFFFFISCALYSFTEFMDALSGVGSGQWTVFFFHTSTGIVAGLRIILALIAFFILQRSRVLDAVWLLAFILLEAYSGHAATFTPVPVTIAFDAIHLLAAAFWVGGLLYLGTHFRKGISKYLPFFSKGAFISLLVLVVSGSIITLIFTPNLAAVLHSSWGTFLILKVFFVVLVYLVAAIIRKRLIRVNPNSSRRWLKVDVAMMLIILIIVGVMTHLSPFPTNNPLQWKEEKMGYDVTTLVYPTNPGSTNTFSVTVSSLTESVENLDLILRNEDKKGLAPFHVPLKKVKSTKGQGGEILVTYEAKGAFLSVPGSWQLELQIYNDNDDYTILKHNLTIYNVKQ